MSELKSEIHNLDHLIKVSMHDRREVKWLRYQPYKKRFLFPDQKEGYVDNEPFTEAYIYTEQQLRDGRCCGHKIMVVDKKAYLMPKAVLKFSDGSSHTKVFETYEGVKKWVTDEVVCHVKNVLVEFYKEE